MKYYELLKQKNEDQDKVIQKKAIKVVYALQFF